MSQGSFCPQQAYGWCRLVLSSDQGGASDGSAHADADYRLGMGDLAEWLGVGGYTPGQWEAFGTMVTAGVAIVAGIFAGVQVRQAKKLREEQAQPYVVVDFEAQANILIALIVRNTGLTVAYDVKLTFDPPLESTLDRDPPISETKFITEGIPTMPPGRTWSALLDRGPDRYANTDLPRTYDVTVTFLDSHDRTYSLPYRLDLDIFFGIRNLRRYDIHEAAEALREMRKTLERWTDGSRGLAVFTRDGDAKDARLAEERRTMLEMVQRNRREDGSIVSEWVEQQMNSEFDESQIAMEPLPAIEARESIPARFKRRRRARGKG